MPEEFDAHEQRKLDALDCEDDFMTAGGASTWTGSMKHGQLNARESKQERYCNYTAMERKRAQFVEELKA